ncbi:Metallo-dependent phosphatase [Violaceomyces palustris]|uniref:Metallo-dependent phosphatase n=1 Tax=Violaceomyces palustris TaxID=1673888 RepID=A0ACD0P7A2_9BASI|nr:Metallo-dependent phosphatase [Violaceomyces palustris]
MGSISLPIVHFNDVYRVRQKDNRSGETLGADQFAAKINSIRKSWGDSRPNQPAPAQGENIPDKRDWKDHSARPRNGLVLFSGDLFSPSVESSVTRGTHLVPVINAMNLDCACLGNHDWDFGYPHLQTLMSQNNFPWLFSNVVDASGCNADSKAWDEQPRDEDAQVEGTLKYWTTTIKGVKVGCIGIVEKEWISTVPSFPASFVYRNMVKSALQLSSQLRDPKGEACDIIIALTHSRLPNDIDFANHVGAVRDPDQDSQGIDLVLGGHDHVYYVSKGASKFEGESFVVDAGTEMDEKTMIVKSGTDFRDLSEITLNISEATDGKIRRRVIESMEVKRHRASPSDPADPALKEKLDEILAKISQSTGQAVAHTLTAWDVRSEKVRTDESAIGNFIADVLMYSYDEVLRERDSRGELENPRPPGTREVDCCITCGGSLRGDSVYGPGKIALSDVLEIMPFEDAVVCKELKGQDIWDALENGLSMYPKQEGRFPQIAGLAVKWDSRKPPGQRLVSVHLLDYPLDTPAEGADGTESPGIGKLRHYEITEIAGGYSVEVHRPPLKVKEPLDMDRTYRVVTREYLADGYDGFEALKRGKFVINHENGQLMSSIVRKFLLGASFIWRMKQIKAQRSAKESEDEEHSTLSQRTKQAVVRARALAALKRNGHVTGSVGPQTPLKNQGAHVGSEGAKDTLRMVVDQSPGAFRDALYVGGSEHHSKFDSVSKRFAGGNDDVFATSGSGGAKKREVHANGNASPDTSDGDADEEDGQDAGKEGLGKKANLFDANAAPTLLSRIRRLCDLLSLAAKDGSSLTKPLAQGDGAGGGDSQIVDLSVAPMEDVDSFSGGPNIALGAIADDDFGAYGYDFGAGSSNEVKKVAEPSQLSKDLVKEAKELKEAFDGLKKAATELEGGEMDLEEQSSLIKRLEAYLDKQGYVPFFFQLFYFVFIFDFHPGAS